MSADPEEIAIKMDFTIGAQQSPEVATSTAIRMTTGAPLVVINMEAEGTEECPVIQLDIMSNAIANDPPDLALFLRMVADAISSGEGE